MENRRVLTIQDISCVGQCSLTVALPVLSAMGCECCVLPTAVLSTHTGGFGAPTVVHLDGQLPQMVAHWQRCGIAFDGILVGYLGSLAAVELARRTVAELLAPGGVCVVDPVMGDHGWLYSGFDETYVQAMRGLCDEAQILLPNATEAALLTGNPYLPEPSPDQARSLLAGLDNETVVLTGIGGSPEETGVLLRHQGCFWHHAQQRLPGSYQGTGDLFAACFTGALLTGKLLQQAAALAAEFTGRCIRATIEAPAHWYGTRFESQLGWLSRQTEQVI